MNPILLDFIRISVTASIIGLVFCVYKTVLYYRERNLKELVAWCVVISDRLTRNNLGLLDYLCSAQIKYNIEDKYRLHRDTDKKYVNIILEDFRRTIVDDYFNGTIPVQKRMHEIQEIDFFMMRLFIYISDKAEAYSVGGMDISSGGKLTDLGIVLVKMKNIAFHNCKDNPIYKNSIAGWVTSEWITSRIE